jgi:hypothetical protein
MVKLDERWQTNFETFCLQMKRKIEDNMQEKGLSWRESTPPYLLDRLHRYVIRNDWVSVANICFMLWENEGEKRKPSDLKPLFEEV